MATYLDAGYNEQLSREVSAPLPSQLDGLQAGNAFSEIEGDTINSEMQGQWVGSGIKANNITTGEMSFNRARGGTLQLGGFDNVSGVFSLLDADEIERIFMNNEGMTITGGKITVKDAKNNSILDSVGLISTANFKGDGIIDTSTYTTTDTGTWADVSGMGMNIIAPRGAKALVGATVIGRNDSVNETTMESTNARLVLDGTQVGGMMPIPGLPKSGGIQNMAASTSSVVNLYPGHHYLKVQFIAITGGTARLTGDQKSIYYIILGS